MIQLKTFTGEFPRSQPQLLPDNAAVRAVDCDFTNGALVGVQERALVPGLNTPTGVRSIYVHDGMARSLFAWTRDVDAVRGPVPNDQYERFYWSDGSGFYVSRGDVGGRGQEPSATNRYKVGCPTPAAAPQIRADTLLALPNVDSVNFTVFCEGADGSVGDEKALPQPTTVSHTTDSYSGSWSTDFSCSITDGATTATGGAASAVPAGVSGLQFVATAGPYQVMRDKSGRRAMFFHHDDYLNSPLPDVIMVQSHEAFISAGFAVNANFHHIGKGWYSSDKSASIPAGAVDAAEIAASSAAAGKRTISVRAVFNMHGGGTQTAILRSAGEHTIPSDFAPWAWTLTAEPGKISYSLVAKNQYKEYRAYAYSYVNQYGEESGLSMPVEIDVIEGQAVNLSYTPLPDSSGYCPISRVRIYRTATGSGSTDYSFVDEIIVNSTAPNYTDIKKGDELGAPSQSASFEAPPQNLRGICMMGNGIMVGFAGNELYFMEPYLPYAYQPSTIKPLPYSIIGICPTDDGLYVTTTAFPYLITGVSPDSMSDRKVPSIQAGVSKGSICSLGATVAYASHDGIVLLRGIDASTNMSFQFFTRSVWRKRYGNKLSVMRMNAHDGNIVVWFEDGTPGFLIRVEEGALSLSALTDPIYAAFVYPVGDALYVAQGNTVYEFKGGDSAKAFEWTSKDFILPKPVNFGALQLVGNGSVTFSVRADGVVKHSRTVTLAGTDSDVFRLPSGFLARKWSVSINGAAGSRVSEMALAVSPMELING